MKKVYIYRILILSIGMLISWHARTQDKVEKQIHAGYQLPADGKFSIDNKYGIVEIEGWDKDSVVIDIIISVKHRYLSKAEDLLDRIEPRFVTREDHIHATSIIRDKRKSIFNDFFKDVFQLDINKTDVDIDYKIMLPNNVELEITNLFGDVVIDNCYGDLTADVSHGTLWLNSLLKSTDIQLKFGRLDVRELPDSRLSLKNSKAYINSTGKIDIESTGSEIEIKDIDFLQVKSARDEYDIERINTI
ncbi:MAG: hypothetical protein KJP00_00755, partial [Bacteroidia bacterium]|nr:hypothetical protein [Bacteroidia bacterium]